MVLTGRIKGNKFKMLLLALEIDYLDLAIEMGLEKSTISEWARHGVPKDKRISFFMALERLTK